MADLNKPSIERAIACNEILSVMNNYASLARENAPFDKMALNFTSDAVFRLPNGMSVHPSEMIKVVQGEEPKYIRHHLTSTNIHFVSQTEARTEAGFFAGTHLSSVDHWGCWRDIFRRGDDGRWLIQDRTIVVEGCDPKGWYAEKYGVPIQSPSK